jgi:hypothetical protein
MNQKPNQAAAPTPCAVTPHAATFASVFILEFRKNPMTPRCCLILLGCFLTSACSRSGSASGYNAEWEARSKQQFADYDRQTKAVDANLAVMERQSKRVDAAQDKSEEQAKRLDRLLEKWDEQARRQDAILEAQEKKLGIAK